MSNKLLINLSQRNLLLNSSFIKNTQPEIYAVLSKNNKISYQIAKEEKIVDKIKQNLSLWLDFSSKEWIPDKKNPRLSEVKDSSEKRCQLCNTKIKFQYKIKNKKNGCLLIIGGNCVDNFKELKTMKKIVSNETEFLRYNKILEYNPYVYDILVTYTDILERTKIILPESYESSFKKIERKTTKIIRSFIRNGKEFEKNELDKLITIHKKEVKNIEKFVNMNIDNKLSLTRERANDIQNNQQVDFSEIIREVKENGGKLLPEISIRIKIEKFLKEKQVDIENRTPDYFKIERVSYGTFFIAIARFNDYYKFMIDSQFLLTKYYRKKLRNIEEVYENNINEFQIYDSETQEKLTILAETFITSNKDFSLKEIDYHKIVSKYDNDLTQDEYSNIYEKVLKLMSKFTLIEKQGDMKLYIFSNSKLQNYGKKLLFVQPKNEIDNLINSFEKILYIDELYSFIISQIG